MRSQQLPLARGRGCRKSARRSASRDVAGSDFENEDDLWESARLFVKLVATAADDPNVLGIYVNGTVLEPAFYRKWALEMKSGTDPDPRLGVDWALPGRKGHVRLHLGTEKFGRREIEVLEADAEPANSSPSRGRSCCTCSTAGRNFATVKRSASPRTTNMKFDFRGCGPARHDPQVVVRRRIRRARILRGRWKARPQPSISEEEKL